MRNWRGPRAYGACWILLLALTLATPTHAPAADRIAVIVARNSPHGILPVTTLSNIFRRRLQIDEMGYPYVPINLPVDHTLRVAFSRALFGQRPRDMQAYWNEQYYLGITPPYVLASTEAVMRFVAATPEAVGYVLGCDVNDTVRVVARLSVSAAARGPTLNCRADSAH